MGGGSIDPELIASITDEPRGLPALAELEPYPDLRDQRRLAQAVLGTSR